MSATIQSDLFSMYFAVPVRGKVEGAPVVTVEGKSFNVVECYLEDLKDIAVSPYRKHDINCTVSRSHYLDNTHLREKK